MRIPPLWAALAAFALLGSLAAVTLEGKYRQAVLILVVGLALRLVVAHLIARQPTADPPAQTPEKP